MSLAGPLPMTMAHNHGAGNANSWKTFSRFNPQPSPTRRTPVRAVPSPALNSGHRTLESLAAELTWLSTSPTAAAGSFGYLNNDVNNFGSFPKFPSEQAASSSSLPLSRDERKWGYRKSKSFPRIRREEPLKSCVQAEDKLPRRSKSVRFADTQGLPLVEAVHQLSGADSSYTENKIVPYPDEDIFARVPLLGEPTATQPPAPKTSSPEKPIQVIRSASTIVAISHKHHFNFTQPGTEPGFFDRVKRDGVALESIREEPRSLHGMVRVANLTYHKQVCIRWTHDNWKSHHDTYAAFCSNDGTTDTFTFQLPINGDDVAFCVRYKTNGDEYWDSNRGQNYSVYTVR